MFLSAYRQASGATMGTNKRLLVAKHAIGLSLLRAHQAPCNGRKQQSSCQHTQNTAKGISGKKNHGCPASEYMVEYKKKNNETTSI
jgi:hypothetical protein